MPYLVAALMIVGVIASLDLVLTLGVIRRLREHTEQLTKLLEGHGDEVILAAGASVGEFVSTTVDGEPVSRDLLAGRTLVSFFSPHCTPCKERMPTFIEYAMAMPGGRQQVLAVVTGRPEETIETVAALTPVARVVVEEDRGPMGVAFGVHGFPAICLLDEHGTVLVSGSTLDEFPTPVAV